MQKAQKKVTDDGYIFKKGHSWSKLYGQHNTTNTPKRPKCDKDMREDRLQAIEEELQDITRMLKFKDKRLSQAEAAWNYKTCEQVTEEIMALKAERESLMLKSGCLKTK